MGTAPTSRVFGISARIALQPPDDRVATPAVDSDTFRIASGFERGGIPTRVLDAMFT